MACSTVPRLRNYKHLPVIIEEDHHEVVPHIHRAIASRHLPISSIVMVHFDSHPDLLLPLHMQADHVFDRESLYNELSIENWILPLVYAGHVDEIFWLKPPWADQLPDVTDLKFKVGKRKDTGEIRVTLNDPYFLTEALYLPESELSEVKVATLHVITVCPPGWKQDSKGSKVSSDASICDTLQPATSPFTQTLSNDSENSASGDHCHRHVTAEKANVEVATTVEQEGKGYNTGAVINIKEGHSTSHEEEMTENNACSPPRKSRRVEKSAAQNSMASSKVHAQGDNSNKNEKEKEMCHDEGVHNEASNTNDQNIPTCDAKVDAEHRQWRHLGEKLEGRQFILDIDLDFFSTKDPFRNEHSSEVNLLLKTLFHFTLPTEMSEKNALDFSRQRQEQLDELESVFQQLHKQPDLTPKLKDPHKQKALDELVGMVQADNCQQQKTVDFEMLFRAGCTFDGTELPHHVSTPDEIHQLMATTSEILKSLRSPTLVTVARSSVDEYCPQDQVNSIQEATMTVLTDIYKDIDIQKHYEQE